MSAENGIGAGVVDGAAQVEYEEQLLEIRSQQNCSRSKEDRITSGNRHANVQNAYRVKSYN